MKKLVLLVSVFLLVAGMVAADVTFAPTVEGKTSVTWGLDLKTFGTEMNSGFDTDSSTKLDLGVTIDPFDAKSGEGIYGEVTISDLSVTADSDADAVSVAVPSIDAKLWFSEAFYASIFADEDPNYDYVSPIGNMITIDGTKQNGTWYSSTAADKGTKIKADYGNAGYGFTYMAGDLTVNADFVSVDKWGFSAVSTKGTNKWKIADFDKGDVDGEKENGILSATEIDALIDAVFGTAAAYDYANSYGAATPAPPTKDVTYSNVTWKKTYTMPVTEVLGYAGATMYEVGVDGGYIEFWENRSDKEDAGTIVTVWDFGDTDNTALYTVCLDVAYTLTDVGTFKAYVIPTHTSHEKMFTGFGFGVAADIALASFDMVGLNVAADMALNNAAGTVASEKFEYEISVTVPITVADLLDVNFTAAWTDAKEADDNTPLDMYANATLTAAGATVYGAYQVSNFAEGDKMTQMYTTYVSYPVAVGEGTITPKVQWWQNMGKPEAHTESHTGILQVSAVAEIVDNVTFTALYSSGDMMTAAANVDPGTFTFKTEFAY